MLEGLLHHKKEEKDYLCALVVTEDRVDAALWEATKDGKVNVLKNSTVPFTGEWEKTIDAADQAVTEIETGLPEGVELTKVVFGLFPEWLTEDRIKDAYLKQLKQLTTSLSLKPLGFVELPTAVVHLLQRDEGTQQTVILVGVESKHVTVSLFKIGKLVGSVTQARTEITADIEGILASFKEVEVLPSRVLLYGTSSDLENLKSDLLNYPWQKKANFLHFPKIEILPEDFAVKAVAIASATEIVPHQPEVETLPDGSPTSKTSPPVDEVAQVAADLGFVKDKDVAEEEEVVPAKTSNEPVNNIVSVPRPSQGIKLPKFSLPKFEFTLRFPRLNKFGFLLIGLILLIIVGGAIYGGYWWLPKATLKILVTPQALDRSLDLTFDSKADEANPEQNILPGREVTTDVNGSKTLPTTGKKTVGDKALGEVTIYNKTFNTKTFKTGTVVTAGNLSFTLDAEVTIASASESVGTLTYGNSKAAVTAADIGSTSNLGPGTDFTFADLPTTSYSARNDKAFSGGSSREVATISREDQKTAREQVLAELNSQAESQLGQNLETGEKLLDKSVTTKTTKETFSKEIGEEADELTVEETVTATGIVYQEADFFTLLESIVANNVPQNFEFNKSEAVLKVVNIGEDKDGKRTISVEIKVNLLPKIDTSDLSKKLAGRSIDDATAYLKSQSNISGVEFSLSGQLPNLKKNLPANPANIKIVVASL
ncbi:MAG: hypothetical protein UV61_C0006G0094 [Candidatus Gottesmanbacteria bacterium GW2011_GWB1_43_11]|uniref:Baseplate protein J-like domain-containing protein n=1 Tax=Candidatus Gottesmanbacteria bacterium GW2011_GWB1_43_11 TaxID=1618446 RepID=A0A0G1FJ63_9BACT|nr:MAG: hypothetical protein UV04_C0005G0093 [Candidatus Gottesmanbacteria bacterium GW2011_GWA2_42_16]KKS55721.1 MAG: hypothetical protein UV17_C0008G0072 [Candidatus Gottesmanbacteria bacterium GW2011_GWA1_42_26]KKS80708.1 MAG: hypothetical protein UV55_C0032G0004 [Candidatus Gottesmanbacteria bacterium GW2011_GWC1_43_10]KKS86893.1 MAG: hypothetical protein UV61_C0006G0094 [Candidatus Gottesmanbacteria bacterium GW2011_GWB1_43_11]OGG10457.1 MAG: hypothetical protein A2699_03720 [Candidatus Go